MKFLWPLLLVFLVGCATEDFKSYSYYQTTVSTSSPPLPPGRPKATNSRIRVAIVIKKYSVHLEAGDPFVISAVLSNSGDEKSYRNLVFTYSRLHDKKAYVIRSGEGELKVDGRPYRGMIEIMGNKGGTLTVINDVELDDYVMGVVAGEVSPKAPLEALKAQAIAARSFAIYEQQRARNHGDNYDLENTAFFQMYQGSKLVNANIQKAVLETQGEILTYKNKPILAFFHSNCGGKTCRALDVWSHDQPYLQSTDCGYGNNGVHFRWKAEISTSDLTEKLRNAGINVGEVVHLRPMGRDGSDRILEIAIQDAEGMKQVIKGAAFRMAMGPDFIKSTRFEAKMDGEKVAFEGRGWGHGVGLCQEGAYGMAAKGFHAFEILRHYYHGAMIEKIKGSD